MDTRLRTPFVTGLNSLHPALIFPNQQRLGHHAPIARIYAAFIQELFQAEPSSDLVFFQPSTFIGLPFFITYTLSQSPVDSPMIALATLSLLYRYKSRISQPQTKLRDPSRLFLSAYLVAAKLLSDKSYPMQTWASLGQNNYSTRELATMEREFCLALDWNLSLNPEVLNSLRIIVEVYLSSVGLPSLGNDLVDGMSSSPDLSSDTHDLAWSSPRSESSCSLSTSSSATNEDWIWIQQEIDESRSMVEDLNNRILELQEEFESFPHSRTSSPRTRYVASGSTKPSMKRRFSKLIRVKFRSRS